MDWSLVSIASSPLSGALNFLCIFTDDFVQSRSGAAGSSENPAQSLLGLTRRALSANHYCDFRFRHIYAFIKDSVGNDDGKYSIGKILKDSQALTLSCVRENRRHQEPLRYLYCHCI
jgi:hypothetical protein